MQHHSSPWKLASTSCPSVLVGDLLVEKEWICGLDAHVCAGGVGGGGMMNMRAAKVSDHWQQNTSYPKKKLLGLKSPNTFQGQSFGIHDSTPPGGGGDNVTTCEGWHLVNDARVSTKTQKNVPQRVHTDLKRRLWLWDSVVKCQRCSVLSFPSVWVTVLEKEKENKQGHRDLDLWPQMIDYDLRRYFESNSFDFILKMFFGNKILWRGKYSDRRRGEERRDLFVIRQDSFHPSPRSS